MAKYTAHMEPCARVFAVTVRVAVDVEIPVEIPDDVLQKHGDALDAAREVLSVCNDRYATHWKSDQAFLDAGVDPSKDGVPVSVVRARDAVGDPVLGDAGAWYSECGTANLNAEWRVIRCALDGIEYTPCACTDSTGAPAAPLDTHKDGFCWLECEWCQRPLSEKRPMPPDWNKPKGENI